MKSFPNSFPAWSDRRFLFSALFSSLRLAFALVCVGVGLILGAQWMGWVPDARVNEEISRRQLCETVSIAAIDDIRQNRWIKLHDTLMLLVARNESLVSVGLRTDTGALRVATESHRENWRTVNAGDASEESNSIPDWAKPKPSTSAKVSAERLLHFEIPVTLHRRHWGNIEFCFMPPAQGWGMGIIDHGLLRLLMYFVGVGMLAYTLLMLRIFGRFSRGQVVPDRVRQALDTLAEGLLVLDDQGHIVLANRNFLEVNGYRHEELSDRSAAELPWRSGQEHADPNEPLVTAELPWTVAIQRRESVVAALMRLTGRDGISRIFSVNAGPIGDDGNKKGALVTFQDVTHVEEHRCELEDMLSMLRTSKDEIQQKNVELEILATRDGLTGCLNRRAFFDKMQILFAEHRRNGIPLSCFMVDVDHFKSVNDTYGHHTGDEVLRKVAKVLRDLHEENQLVCRYGGEEFCVVLPGADMHAAWKEAEKTRLAIADIRLEDPDTLRLTASFGVSDLSFDAVDTQGLINQADSCLYVAKRGGRNQCVNYDPNRAEDEPETPAPTKTEEPPTVVEPNLVRLPFAVVTSLLSALAHRDPDTAEHSRRVADLCIRAAEGVLNQRSTYVLEIAALLHDIGKIGVPDGVLHKQSSLSDSERETMMRLGNIGSELVSGTFQCPELETIIRQHHARLAGSDAVLPWESMSEASVISIRLLAIADAYDAILSDRSYRKGRSHDDAATELRAFAGSQFDAQMLEHFLSKIVDPSDTELDIALGVGTARGITFAIPRSTANQIGDQLEALATAMDAQDVLLLTRLVAELSSIADENFLFPISESAERIRAFTRRSENIQWTAILEETQKLMNLCRSTQNSHLVDLSKLN